MGKELEKREKAPIVGEGAQYALALGVIAVMLYVVGLPAFVIFFLGAFSFFLWKLFSSGSASETRRIFEFYLAANEILRDDERRWYGFEIQETIARGEKILATMHSAPPVLYYAIGALYHKVGDYGSALKNLEYVFESGASNESAIVYPTKELREYVRILRKIEREPGEAPQTSAAIRSLERSRKNKGKTILEDCRRQAQDTGYQPLSELKESDSNRFVFFQDESANAPGPKKETTGEGSKITRRQASSAESNLRDEKYAADHVHGERKPISEVLQDIYDDKVQ